MSLVDTAIIGMHTAGTMELRSFGTYRLVRPLANPGAGFRHFVASHEDDPPGALPGYFIKMLAGGSGDEHALLRAGFEHEIRLLKSFNHPSIPSAHGDGEHGGVRFLVMDYIDGVDLAQLLGHPEQTRGLSREVAVYVLAQLADALHYVHTFEVFDDDAGDFRSIDAVHRDIAPSNVLLSRQGNVLLADFNTAASRWLSPEHDTVHAGTKAYMAPERIIAAAPATPLSDLWSMAVILWEMLRGQRCFKAEDDPADDRRDRPLRPQPPLAADRRPLDQARRGAPQEPRPRPRPAATRAPTSCSSGSPRRPRPPPPSAPARSSPPPSKPPPLPARAERGRHASAMADDDEQPDLRDRSRERPGAPSTRAISEPASKDITAEAAELGPWARLRADRRLLTPALIAAFATYAYFVGPPAWNQNSRLALTRALVERGELTIDPDHFTTGDKSRRGDHFYSDKAPGASLLAVPAYAVYHGLRQLVGGEAPRAYITPLDPAAARRGDELDPEARLPGDRLSYNQQFRLALYLSRLFSTSLLALAGVAALYLLALRQLAGDRLAALTCALTYGLATPALVYGAAFYGHQPCADLLLLAPRRDHALPEDRGPPRRPALRRPLPRPRRPLRVPRRGPRRPARRPGPLAPWPALHRLAAARRPPLRAAPRPLPPPRLRPPAQDRLRLRLPR
jgi:serine/threonine protein kinase